VTTPLEDAEKNKVVKRTFKNMFALVKNIPIVEYRWVRDCMTHGKLYCPEKYRVMRDVVSDKGFKLAASKVNRWF
jgi:hypothetical protein